MAKPGASQKCSQSLVEYFLLLGVFAVLVAIAAQSGGFNDRIMNKALEYRDSKGMLMAISSPPQPADQEEDNFVCYNKKLGTDYRSRERCCQWDRDIDGCYINGEKVLDNDICRHWCTKEEGFEIFCFNRDCHKNTKYTKEECCTISGAALDYCEIRIPWVHDNDGHKGGWQHVNRNSYCRLHCYGG